MHGPLSIPYLFSFEDLGNFWQDLIATPLEAISDTVIQGQDALSHFVVKYSGWSVEVNATIPLDYARNNSYDLILLPLIFFY